MLAKIVQNIGANNWGKSNVGTYSFRERKEAARNFLTAPFDAVTFIIDGTDVRMWLREGKLYRLFYSFKFKRPEVRTQIVILADGTVHLISNTVPASMHDKRMADDMIDDVDEEDQGMGDAAYIGLDMTWGIAIWTPRTKPRNGSLSKYESICNGILQAVRNEVEHVIGDMKNTMGALSYNIRDAEAESLVNHLWYFAAALQFEDMGRQRS